MRMVQTLYRFDFPQNHLFMALEQMLAYNLYSHTAGTTGLVASRRADYAERAFAERLVKGIFLLFRYQSDHLQHIP